MGVKEMGLREMIRGCGVLVWAGLDGVVHGIRARCDGMSGEW